MNEFPRIEGGPLCGVAPDSNFSVLGVRVHAVQIPDVMRTMEQWISERTACHMIAVTGMHGVTEAQHDSAFKNILNSADLVVPDGMPLVWIGSYYGYQMRRRVYGPELMQTFCNGVGSRYRHFLYGGKPDVTPLLARTLREECGVDVVDYYSPPFRTLSETEDREIVLRINSANSDVLWVGLSTPKQERWMHSHRSSLNVPVVAGVGAAFDIISGVTRQAPSWMRENGLEWGFRLLLEPKRLWRRYLVYGPEFAFRVGLELLTESQGRRK